MFTFTFTFTQMEYEDPYHRQAPWHPRSTVKVARSLDASDRCWSISREWNVLETQKLAGRLTTNNAHQFQGKRSKVKVTWPINSGIKSVSYLPKVKAYQLQTWYTDGARRHRQAPWPPSQRSRSLAHVVPLTSVVRYWRYLDTYRRYLRDDTSIAKVTIYRGIS